MKWGWAFVLGVTASASLVGCRDYTCQDTATCEATNALSTDTTGTMSNSSGSTSPPPVSSPAPNPPATGTVNPPQATSEGETETEETSETEATSEPEATSETQPETTVETEPTSTTSTPSSDPCAVDPNAEGCNPECTGCLIDDVCQVNGAASPSNPCLVCDPAESASDWTVDEGAECDDGAACTTDDACNAQGECTGQDVTCTNDEGACGATRSCDPSSGLCVAAYPGDDVGCTDGDPCTASDHCNGAGECEGTPSEGEDCECLGNADCNDNISCTTDTCNQGQCSWTVNANNCLINGQCYAANAQEPGNVCRMCSPGTSNSSWSNASSSTSCNDNLWCNGDDTCNGQGSCSHSVPSGNRCANATGACEVQTCNESKDSCFAAAGTVCSQSNTTGCLSGEADVCSSDVKTWPVQYTCSGSSANCGTTPTQRTDLATVSTNCGADEACHASSGTCRPKLGCSSTYCKSGLCWTKTNAPGTYAQEAGRTYCSNLSFIGEDTWRLPSVAQMQTLVEGPTNNCYWPTVMGDCTKELWTTDDSQSFAFWVGTAALQINTTPLYVRCVTEQ